MGLLDSFERGLERAVNGAFAKTFRSGIQPVEIASALRAELDKKSAVISRDRTLAPNSFVVSLAPADADRMSALGPTLLGELTTLVNDHARAQGYSLAGPVSVTLVPDPSRATGTLAVAADTAKGQVEWTPVVEINGTEYPLAGARTVIGRGSNADVTIADSGSSRAHAEILWDGNRAMVRDLRSTNGTRLDGNPITEAALPPDSTITIGRTNIVFRFSARAQNPRATIFDAEDPGSR